MGRKLGIFAAVTALLGAVFLLIGCLGQGSDAANLPANQAQDSMPGNRLLEQRSSYGISMAVFSALPEPARDFNAVVSHYVARGYPDESFFSRKYYLQPEFYPSFIGSGLQYWTNPSPTHWAAYGYGSYPTKKHVKMRAGESITITFFVHSGYGARSYQGMGLRSDVEGGDGNVAVEFPEGEFLLGPSFPAFSPDWAHSVNVHISPRSSGDYAVKVFAHAPSKALSEKGAAIAASRNLAYFDAGFVDSGSPLIDIIIEAD